MMKLLKKILSAVGVLALACTTAFGGWWSSYWRPVNIDSTNFPDATFRNYVSSTWDKNGDGVINEKDDISNGQLYVDIQGLSVTNLKGLELLDWIQTLHCNFPFDNGGRSFNFTKFKQAYGLNEYEIDDSTWLRIPFEISSGRDGLMTVMINDIKDTSTGDYVLNLPLDNNKAVAAIEIPIKSASYIHRGTRFIWVSPGFYIFP